LTTYPIDPVAKPRQTRSDKWKKRACVVKYRRFSDLCREHKVHVPECGAHITFYLPMPDSWSEKRKAAMDGTPHQQTPDKDNLEKALLDAVYGNDCVVWDSRVTKRWARAGSIEIKQCGEAP
jgi:Holliday junction resolvase RusA-like endonuclease